MPNKVKTIPPKLQEIENQAGDKANEYKGDLFHAQLGKALGLKIPAPDETIVGILTEKMTKLQELLELEEQIATKFNCKKEEILQNVITNIRLFHDKEQAERQLERERETFQKTLLEFENEVSRNSQTVDTLRASYNRLLDELHELKDENKRLGFWDKLFGRGGEGEA